MQLKKPNKSLILLLSLLLIGTPTNSQASQTHSSSNPKKLVIPMLAFTFLSNRLMTLSDTKQSMSLFGTIHKLNVSPEKLTQEEMKGLNEYVKQETIQLGNELPSIKDHNKLQTKQNTYQQLTSLQQQLALLYKASFPQTIHRPHELPIPANGKCLYTSIILGYLLPVVNNQKAFDQRLHMIMDKQKLPITPEDLANHYNDLDYLDSNPAFQQIINALLKQIGIKPGTWGGPKEIRLIAEKLNVNIQEYTPNPDSPKQLIKGDLTSPKNWLNAPEATLHVVQDTPLKGELVNPDDDLDLQQGQLSSLQGLQNRHHYRLYYTGSLSQLPQQQQNTNLSFEQKDTDEENPKHTSILPDNAPQPKTSLPDLLKTHYKAQNQIPGLLGDKSQPLESCYIHLAMLTEEEHKVKKEKFLKKQPKPDDDEPKEDDPQEEEKSWNKSMDYAILHKVQKPIKLEDLWKPEENQLQAPRHVVVTGEAGTGKSTLSQYIAYQWAKGSLWQDRFHWLLQLPLRKVRDLSDQQSSHNQIATSLGIPNVHGKDLQNLLQQKQPGLLILDGYDEVAIEVQKENSPLAQWLQPCFDNKDNLSIILTTRPGPHCPYVKQHQDLRVLGFQQQDIDRYVETYFTPEQPQNNNQKPGTSKKAKALLQVMQQNPTLKLLSHTPLYLRLLCILAKQQGAHALSQCSTPQLYEQIIAQFLCYNLARHNNQPPTDEEQDLVFKTYGLELMYLGELALEGMKASQAVLPVDLQKKLLKQLRHSHPRNVATEPEYWFRIASLGLLQGYTCSSPRPNLPTYFPHLTIQEWLAAHYLVTALYDNQHKDHHTAKAIINQDKYEARYQVMLPFVAGICYQHIRSKNDSQGKGLTAFWTLLNAQPRELSGIHHPMLIARCLEACKANISIGELKTCHTILIKQVAAWLQALLNHPFDEKDVDKDGGVLLPRIADTLQAGLQGCLILLDHKLITQQVKPTWHKLSLELDWYGTNTRRWYTRVAKIKALARIPLSHPTAKHLSTYLGQALQHKYDGVRSTALKALPDVLQALESQDRKAFIINALKDTNEDVRSASARALPDVLQALEPQDRKACINPFIGALKDKEWRVREAAAEALPSILGTLEHQDRKAFINPFIGTLKDKEWRVREAAAEALPSILGTLEHQDRKAFIIGTLKDKEWRVREAAAEALPGVLQALEPEDRKACINPFIGTLKDDSKWVRSASARALPGVLQALESQDRKAFIIGTLKDDSKWVRSASARALPGVLQALEPQDRKACINPFIGALKDTNEDVRRDSARALPGVLKALEPQDRKACINPFIGTLKDTNKYVRRDSARALPGVLKALESQDRKACINPFIDALKDIHDHVQAAALKALPGVLQALESQDRKACINPFIDALKDIHDHVQAAALKALPDVLKALEPEERKALMIPFIGALKDKNKYVRITFACALPGVLKALEPEELKAFITPFIEALKDKDSDVQCKAAKALPGVIQALEPQDRKACINPFIDALKDKNKYVRITFACALPGVLKALEPQDRKACINPFIDALKDKDRYVRSTFACALPGVLKALEPQDRKDLIPPFIDALKDKNYRVRSAAAGTLPGVIQALEPQDRKDLIPPFIDALKDKNYPVRSAAAGALQEIDNKIWQSGLQYQLQAKPQQQDMEDTLKASLGDWAYLLLRGSLLICFSKDEQNELPSYKLLIEALQKQTNTWGWPVHAYSVKPLPDDFNPSLPKLPAITIHRPLDYTPLHDAAQKGNVQALETLWKKNDYSHEHLNNQHNQDQLTPLLCALQHKKWKKAQWLIDQGAWLDVADKYGQSPLQKIITLRHWYQHKEALALIKYLLQKRTFFPKKRIDDKVKYVIEQGLDKETKARKPLAQKTYHKHLCTAVTDLLGEDVGGFQEGLLKRRDFYEAASKNVEKEKRENIDKQIKYTGGLTTGKFLPYRIALLFDVLVNLQQGDFTNKLPDNSEGEVYDVAPLYEIGLQELQTQLTTFWANKLMDGIFTLRFDLNLQQLKSCYQAWALGIANCLPKVTFPQEVSLALGYAYPNTGEGHCIYVSLTHTSTHYIVRVDNRWVNNAPKKSHPITPKTFYNTKMDALQPYAVAYFPVQVWDKHKTWLVGYITRAGELNQERKPATVIKHLYQTQGQEQKPPKEGNKPSWIKDWPWRPLQTTAENCFMRSHNVGYRIRLGNKLYKWFRQKSSTSYLLERQFIEDQLATSSPDKGPKLQGGSNQMGNNKQSPEKAFKPDEEETKEDSPQPQPKDTMYISPKKSKFKKSSPKQTTSSKKLPSHQEVMKRFAKTLKVNYDAVYSGIAAEQSLVRYAGLIRPQTGAMFRRDNTGYTWFKLSLTLDEVEIFVDYYITHHSGWIQDITFPTDDWIHLLVDTAQLYHEVIPQLRPSSNSKQQGKPKKEDNKPKDRQQKEVNTNKKPQSEDTKYIAPKKSTSKPTKQTPSKKLPSHQEVIQRFSQQLRINDHNTMLHSKAIQQAVVGYAGISRSQQGARFDRDSFTGHICFILRLTPDEAERFIGHYLMHHPGWIQDMRLMKDDWLYLLVNTAQLYDEVIPQLKPSPSNSKQQAKPKKEDNKPKDNGQQVMNTNKKPQSEDTKYIPPKKSTSKPTKQTPSKKLPTHQEVMKRFAKKLRLNYDAVYSGIAAEQALVRYAGVSQTQTGAMFRRDSQTGYTWFKLRLNSYEANLFMDHYQTLHPDAIKKRTTLGNDWVRIVFDTARLYHEIIPNLV